MCNFDDTFQFSFYDGVVLSNNLHAEIQTLLIDIKLCWQGRFRRVTCS